MTMQVNIQKPLKVIRVGDDYRTNSLSLQPGGVDVKVYYPNGTARIYSRIKDVGAYTHFMKKKFNVLKVETL
tara:strand:- start:141 stop:356 length:216 start_codon:yes stop_codon:yes gene_type:complete